MGCTTKAKINDVWLSYPTVRKVVMTNMPLGVRDESPNGREITSNYFSPKNWEVNAAEKSERAYAKAVILGSSRPYKIDIKIVREKKSGKGYVSLGEDKKLTQELVEAIRDALADRREERNIIDEFRAF
jgi:hypothetical protein